MEASSSARSVHAELARVWGGKPKVFRHGDELESHSVFVAHLENVPTDGVVSVATIGLSDHDLGMGPVRVELIGAFDATFAEGANIAATCAFNAFKDGWPTRPDAVHVDVVRMYSSTSTVPHILLTDPFLWEQGPQSLKANRFNIAWLMMVPIAEAELAFAEIHGFDQLSQIFEREQIDIFDLFRPSVV